MKHRAHKAVPLALALIVSGQGAALAYEPSINYALQCMGCHTPDGSGVDGRVPSVRETLAPFARMPEGRRFLVQVPGAAQSSLTDAELAALLNWMIESFSSDAARSSYQRFTEAEVAAYRKQALITVRETRERLLAASAP